MDSIAEVMVRVIGEILREIFEALFRFVFGRIARLIGFVYNGIHRTVRWNLNSDFVATPVTLLLMLALGCAVLFTAVKAIQWMIA